MGPIAQSVEQRTFNPWVDGSSPSGPTFLIKNSFTVNFRPLVNQATENTSGVVSSEVRLNSGAVPQL
jgi:hypothetical protein